MRGRAHLPWVLAAAALVVLAGAVLVLRVRGSGGATDFGAGPDGAPERQWAVRLDEASAMAVVSDGERVYVVREELRGRLGYDPPSELTAYAAADGDELWSVDLVTPAGADPVRPLGHDELLVSGHGAPDTTALLDARTGEVAWEAVGEPHETADSLGEVVAVAGPAPGRVLLLDRDDRIAAVDRGEGVELWSVPADAALLCGEGAVTVDEVQPGPGPRPGRITGRGATDGEERWSVEGVPGRCDDDAVAVGRVEDDRPVVALVEVGSGRTTATYAADGTGTAYGIPTADHVVVTWSDLDAEDPASGVAIHPRAGGEPVYTADDAVAVPVSDTLALVAGQGDGRVRLVRLADGEEVGPSDLSDRGDGCAGFLGHRTVLVCEQGEPTVTSYALAPSVRTRWTVDVGTGVVAATVGDDRLFVITADRRLVALR
jgi:outer membrane protein assembly factor BamB